MSVAWAMAVLAAASPPIEWHALIIGNNASPTQSRPRLSYADDDSIRYALALGPVVPEERRVVLTRLDGDSQGLQDLGVNVTAAPTVAAVKAAFETVRVRLERAGGSAGLYLFFAGHGDVEAGQGFLELEDGRLTGAALEAWLSTLRAAEVHLVLDSCNSFFMLSPRKPGGRRFGSPEDLSSGLARRLPQVGVFLSTGANAETWEWSELESGVFSYLIRSGLAGPADLDGDEVITYGELRRFVAIAASDVRNARLRPTVFARGPEGRDERPFLRLSRDGVVGFSRLAGRPARIALRDVVGTRWLEAHVEAEQPLQVRVPRVLARHLVVESLETGVRSRLSPDPDQPLETLELAAEPPLARRGTPALAALFATAFGPRSVAAHDAATPASTGFGVTDAEFARLLGLLEQLTAVEARDRTRSILLGATSAATLVGIGAVGLATRTAPCSTWCDVRADGAFLMVAGAGAALLSTLDVVLSSWVVDGPRRLLEDAQRLGERPDFDRAQFSDRAERVFIKALEERRSALRVQRWGWGLALVASAGFAVARPLLEAAAQRPFDYRATVIDLAGLGVLVANLIVDALREGERERMMEHWLQSRPASSP